MGFLAERDGKQLVFVCSSTVGAQRPSGVNCTISQFNKKGGKQRRELGKGGGDLTGFCTRSCLNRTLIKE